MPRAMTQRSLFLLIDIDDTLYEYEETGFGKQIHDLIFEYAEKKIGLSAEEAEDVSLRYYLNYGLSLRGYVEHYHVDSKSFSDYVHQCSYERLSYNAPLVDMLTRLHYGSDAASPTEAKEGNAYGQRCAVHHLYYFTNANRPHARRTLEAIGLKTLFTRTRQAGSPTVKANRRDDAEGFEDGIEWLGFSYEDQWRLTGEEKANKPMRAAYEGVFRAIGEEIARDEEELNNGDCTPTSSATAENGDEGEPSGTQAPPQLTSSPTRAFTEHKRACLRPESIVMVDDSLVNLDAPLALGWNVVWYAHGDLQLPGGNDAYHRAVGEGRMHIIRNILELESAVSALAAR